ncbi:hypothetical protein [Pseudomonas savastanoi]|uniref:hypothetical protein n=1 Tax=Pseudomonas savastanoi TaxID=29438 RepID=UPI0013C2BD56|nr:hypothetical protein [Pseudomonas savastanoi]
MPVVELGAAGDLEPAVAIPNFKGVAGHAGFEVAFAKGGWVRGINARALLQVLKDFVAHFCCAVLGRHLGCPIERLVVRRQEWPEKRVDLPTDMKIKRL